jgi:hypothetical protein
MCKIMPHKIHKVTYFSHLRQGRVSTEKVDIANKQSSTRITSQMTLYKKEFRAF